MKFLSSLKNKNLSGETCILRVDLDIENTDLRGLNADSRGQLPFRLEAALATIKFLIDRRAKVVILSHRGRPNPAKRGISKSEFLISKQLSLRPFTKILSQKIKKPITFINFHLRKLDFLRWKREIEDAPPGSIFMLENLRFFPGEIKNDKKLARQLTLLGTFYVNDAFAVSHRAEASVAAITKFLPSYAGLHLENEIKNLSAARDNFKKPLVLILGGVKVSDKIGLLQSFYSKADYFLLGGAIVNTIFSKIDFPIGNFVYEDIEIAPHIMSEIGKKIVLPVDTIIYNNKILDIGPETIKKYKSIIAKAKTIIWNGPLGLIENKRFRRGSEEIAKAILKSRAHAVIGGGETISLVKSLKLKVKSSRIFISTGGGAMMEFLAGKKLPGIATLK